MDVPLHLRLAYASRQNDVYGDRRRAGGGAVGLAPSTPPLRSGQHWFSSLIESTRPPPPDAVLWFAEAAVNKSATAPFSGAAPVGGAETPSATPQMPRFFDEDSVAVASASVPSPSPPPPLQERQPADGVAASSPPPHAASSVSEARRDAPPWPSTPPDAVLARVQAEAQADIAADSAAAVAAHAHATRVREELAGTYVAPLADVVASLERRLHGCVRQVVALDGAAQQLVCAFQPTPSTHVAPARVDASTGDAEASTVAAASPATAPALPRLSANRTEATLSEEAKKEMALHLYGLRHQVQRLRDELETHEATHYRQVNALRAATAARHQHAASLPPLRVEVVKAYEDDPVPYRKGPWREANFTAAAGWRARDGGAGAVSDAGDESYPSDDFTEITSAASSEVRTEDGEAKGGAGGNSSHRRRALSSSSSSSVSSTEDLFRRRQAAALRARALQGASQANATVSRSPDSSSSLTETSSTTSRSTATDTETDTTLTTATRTSTDDSSDTE
ncbi:hypothetical protein NESM_000864900 [Novymonas esmeraldas]|uniref:Uncharacterized protein n=1 Tax=Novymonas esmeraldas TaxID=1808958 RepID=A0AAW0EYL7_9TRYP